MKTKKELQRRVTERLRCSWGENIALFFITVGGISAVCLAWLTAEDSLRAADLADMSPDGGHIQIIMHSVTAVSMLLLWCMAVPFTYGVKWYRLQQIRGNSVHARSIFSCYGSWKRTAQVFKLSISLFLRRLPFTFPLAAVFCGGAYLALRITEKGGIAAAAAVLLLFLTGICLVCAAAALNYRYAAAPYLFALDPDAPPKELIKRSIAVSEGKGGYITEAMMSASVWFAPCIFIFPAVFVIPYIQMTYTAAVNELIEDSESTEGNLHAEEYAQY